MLVAAVDPSVVLGVAFAGVGVVAALTAAFVVWRGGGGTALSTLSEANRVLESRVHELEKAGKVDAATIAELRTRTDVALALTPLVDLGVTHEERAQQRHEATLSVLDLIAQRLGPESERQ